MSFIESCKEFSRVVIWWRLLTVMCLALAIAIPTDFMLEIILAPTVGNWYSLPSVFLCWAIGGVVGEATAPWVTEGNL